MIYLDSSALIKLVRVEPETPELRSWLTARAELQPASSVIARIEVIRSCRRYSAAALAAARGMLTRLDVIPLTEEVVAIAGDIEAPNLRSLDAIHLASALSARPELSAFCTYDHRLYAAAVAAGLLTVAPGARDRVELPKQ